jgi:putative transposase
MPLRLKRFQHAHQDHFITFTCYQRKPRLNPAAAKDLFEQTLERVRRWYGICVYGYVAMPEHVHLLVGEPERGNLATAIQMLKQIVARKRNTNGEKPFWERRYYDFNVWSERKFKEKLRYIHRNPVRRGLVDSPEDWPWSSFLHYFTGVEGVVEIESEWTARKRERTGTVPRIMIRREA